MQVSAEHIILLVVSITAIFLVAAVFLLLYINMYNRRKKRHIEEKKRMEQAFGEELIKSQMEVQEQTLQTIASDIHDNIGQLLSITKLTLSTVNIQNDPLKAQQKIGNSLGLLDTAIRELRQLSAVLHAQNLLANGLENAVQNELSWLARSDQYEVICRSCGNANYQIDPQKELMAFRLIQELINNILKHAAASVITVYFMYEPQQVKISIADNGKGFEVAEAIAKKSGLGITNLYKRAGMIGGDFKLVSEKGKGTCAMLMVPLLQKNGNK
jgi:two-component system NarL family sensor kinase